MQVEGAARYSSADLMGQAGAASPRPCGGEQFVDSSSAGTLPSIGQCAGRKGRSRPMDDRVQACKASKCAGVTVQVRILLPVRSSASL